MNGITYDYCGKCGKKLNSNNQTERERGFCISCRRPPPGDQLRMEIPMMTKQEEINSLVYTSVEDAKCSLAFVADPAIVEGALKLAKTIRHTATLQKILEAKLRKMQKADSDQLQPVDLP